MAQLLLELGRLGEAKPPNEERDACGNLSNAGGWWWFPKRIDPDLGATSGEQKHP